MSTDSGRRIEFVVAALASFVSLLALAVSAYATYWQRQQARAQVWPRLQLGSYTEKDFAYYALENVGTGPAEIRAVEVTFDGKPVRQWEELRALVGGKPPVKGDFSTASLRARVLGSGNNIKILGGRGPDAVAAMSQVFARTVVRLCYCSILEECWSLRSSHAEDSVVPVSSCRSEPDSFEN